jgi:hypothetical protein
MDQLATALDAFVNNWIKDARELPTEVCTSTCLEYLKTPHKLNASIKVLQQKYNKIIKDFDTSKHGLLIVTYWKLELPKGQNPTD